MLLCAKIISPVLQMKKGSTGFRFHQTDKKYFDIVLGAVLFIDVCSLVPASTNYPLPALYQDLHRRMDRYQRRPLRHRPVHVWLILH